MSEASATATSVRLMALDLLAQREHSARELQDKLAARFPELSVDAVILPVVEGLREDAVQSDARFSEAYVHYRGSRGVGPLKIAQELRARGIERTLLREALAGVDWDARCREVLLRKFSVRAKAPAAERARWMRFLAQRGFEAEQVRSALRQLDQDQDSEA
ncbi:MAG: recombination regulator RecX [Pseudomonadales bacterium]|jgi:regulatory protein|nr:recombination regulator RecX [Pseudomonadales bacterium]